MAKAAAHLPAADRFAPERALVGQGHSAIAGVDEAGRGPLAGPVVAAAVILPRAWILEGMPEELRRVNDSKQVKAQERETLFTLLTTRPEIRYGIAVVAAGVIDEINILQATYRAMNEALAQLRPAPEHVLVDGLRVKAITLPQTPLVKGDSLSYSIAAASILAKVTRDRLMLALDAQFPAYGFARHKGYGTAAHLAAMTQHGLCPEHRRSFAPAQSTQNELF